MDFNEVLARAFRLSTYLRLRTLDLLHVVVCEAVGAECFAALDKDIVAESSAIKEATGVDVVTA